MSPTLFATAPQGLEDLLASELDALGAVEARPGRGGVAVRGGLANAYRICLWSRVAGRVLLPIAEFDADDADALYAGARTVDWSDHLAADGSLAVDFTGIKPAITHARFAQQRVKDAVVDRFRETAGVRPDVDPKAPDLRIHVHQDRARTTVSIDLSGDSLHKRGYREDTVEAPLKEHLAAAMLLRAEWPRIAAEGGGLVDPMCGSGTLPIEAAWMAGDVAPGLLRTRFGFQRWRGHDDALWKDLIDEALDRQEAGVPGIPPIVGYDRDGRAIKAAIGNLERAGLRGRVHVEKRELGQATPPKGVTTGLVATNPPYGERIGDAHELMPLYVRLGDTLKRRFAGWEAVVLNGAGCEIGLKPTRTWAMRNGAIECRLERFELGAAPGGDGPAAEDLHNRLTKNRKNLGKWLRREDITCYRVYDADLPEYALAVDVYGSDDGDWLHVQEYEAPASVDAGKARSRLRAALATIPEALEVPPERMVFKVRRRQKGHEQYQRHGERGRFLTVREGPARLAVNLTDYLDTGLFLDHRPVRRWIGEQARDQRFLNLFGYTGAATVHAAVGGAAETTTVDLSKTYLDWLRRNLDLNGLDRLSNRIVHADVIGWLQRAAGPYDLVFLDPPSFSNSKRMDDTLDVQRDHPTLIRAAMRLLAPGGTLIFSNNLRSFSMDGSLTEEFAVEDRTGWSIPKDFERNRRIHGCWFVRHRG
ncbi:bifunctional 23S rRNA (guanine(2069)-N(7))-methyltransferase RlmK/23S rRNA (guanine(2445)-N(2))-methyltransferase RlmL [Wenzhouxiangella sp. XN79A]|uniref:bifunctional 23S rRNA (guanine(2069)-N(7))-methyltransferase RlmK/23S rRNA (guanine(2445)-N(2))-methyltransferase RlmL n=1 Tax=Wenzhouxiangella sp. XN79A TaxID=2724193 RepID=UPI00144AB276|nr:bifunctional 23S rRNA (guanine(2069)-N(7))-methyltransferase RlmK/23S rRNA (guanine(2445)-N(2))-methyltransferase RlmL [Wenzhouxiangella sp. XN79A]NKI35228.1 bifunctional 23S rRNA (guanine(2069)-N(7))-methyltransferase RlmK/23S rRNA (guanine(2445)-N(2))-methyltransferase RlmL [Wenzhouxiangella sp. XN79A]